MTCPTDSFCISWLLFLNLIGKKSISLVSVARRESELTHAASTCDAQADMHSPSVCPREFAAKPCPLSVQAARRQLQPRCVHWCLFVVGCCIALLGQFSADFYMYLASLVIRERLWCHSAVGVTLFSIVSKTIFWWIKMFPWSIQLFKNMFVALKTHGTSLAKWAKITWQKSLTFVSLLIVYCLILNKVLCQSPSLLNKQYSDLVWLKKRRRNVSLLWWFTHMAESYGDQGKGLG